MHMRLPSMAGGRRLLGVALPSLLMPLVLLLLALPLLTGVLTSPGRDMRGASGRPPHTGSVLKRQRGRVWSPHSEHVRDPLQQPAPCNLSV